MDDSVSKHRRPLLLEALLAVVEGAAEHFHERVESLHSGLVLFCEATRSYAADRRSAGRPCGEVVGRIVRLTTQFSTAAPRGEASVCRESL